MPTIAALPRRDAEASDTSNLHLVYFYGNRWVGVVINHDNAYLYYADALMIYDDRLEFEPARLERLMDVIGELKVALRELSE